MQLRNKIVMDKESRPSREDIKEVTDLFTYIEVPISSPRINVASSKETLQA
jgi:hypothetical protein